MSIFVTQYHLTWCEQNPNDCDGPDVEANDYGDILQPPPSAFPLSFDDRRNEESDEFEFVDAPVDAPVKAVATHRFRIFRKYP